MGGTHSSVKTIEDLDLEEWQQTALHREVVQIVKSNRGRGFAQLNTISFDPKRNYQKQLEIYLYRKNSSLPLVRCLGVKVQNLKSHHFCGSNKVLKVLTEKIPYRLSELPQLSFPESLYCLGEALRGYGQCYTKLGLFQITDQMMGIDEDGHFKVWVNEDFGENHPNTEKPFLQTTELLNEQNFGQTENIEAKGMVRTIVELVERKTETGIFPPDFRSRIYQKGNSFQEAFETITLMVKQKNLFIPNQIMKTRDFSYMPEQVYFTPGSQYQRSTEDPLFRQSRQVRNQYPSPVTQNFQIASNARILSPISHLQQPPNQSLKRLSPGQGSKLVYRQEPQLGRRSVRIHYQ